MIVDPLLALAILSAAAWAYLLLFRGGFWRARERLDGMPEPCDSWPPVTVLVPARNEAEVIGQCTSQLVAQRYPGSFRIVIVDDNSEDGTAAAAQAAGRESRAELTVIRAAPLPAGWAGKMWALSQGFEHARAAYPDSRYFWLTDADIAHDPDNLQRLVARAEKGRFDLVSQMVMLLSEGFWARLLIPAFVLFFQKLYPFAWVNDPHKKVAAAAGGSVLIRTDALQRVGGFAAIRDAIIDDCTLAAAVKRPEQSAGSAEADDPDAAGRIWLGLTTRSESLRPYHGLGGVWRMVARSAFTQLRYSALLLTGTLAGMTILYLSPPAVAVAGAVSGYWGAAGLALGAWALMTLSFVPTLRLYRQPVLLAPALPLAGFLYSLMTIGSAFAYWRGRGGAWKGRAQAHGGTPT